MAVQAGSDAAEYRFLTTPGASVECHLVAVPDGPELQLFGNRAGLLSLANILLWFIANAWRREIFSLGELEFVRMDEQRPVYIRLSDDVPIDSHGSVQRQEQGELEWLITEEGLRQVALWMHRLVSMPAHEYDRLLVAEGSDCDVHVRMTDAGEWIDRGIA